MSGADEGGENKSGGLVPDRPELDLDLFLRPYAHRGLHGPGYGPGNGHVENSAPAFLKAIERGHGIECDLRPAQGGVPVVFHDQDCDRLLGISGRIADVEPDKIAELRYPECGSPLLTFADFLSLVDGRVPVLAEIKSDWSEPDPGFLPAICELARGYQGPLALMSFDPTLMTIVANLSPEIPRGLVSRDFTQDPAAAERLGRMRAYALTNLLDQSAVAPSFIAYDINALPTPAVRYVREFEGLPVFAWTVRSPTDWLIAGQWADAAIFEGPCRV